MTRLLLTSDHARGLFRLARELEELRRGAADEREHHALGGLVRLVGADSAAATVASGPPPAAVPRIATWGYLAACGGGRLQSIQDGRARAVASDAAGRGTVRALAYPAAAVVGAGASGSLASLAPRALAARLDAAAVLDSPTDASRANRVIGLALGRATAGRPFTDEDASALHLFHVECGWALTREIAVAEHAGLTPRERATLECLLAGASEKEAAARLGLSVHTVHQYVKCLYRAFAVRSRAELMARCLGREGAGRAPLRREIDRPELHRRGSRGRIPVFARREPGPSPGCAGEGARVGESER